MPLILEGNEPGGTMQARWDLGIYADLRPMPTPDQAGSLHLTSL